MTDEKNNVILDSFASYLKSKGMRETYERTTILKTIIELSKSFDFQMLSSVLGNKGSQICRATVFNTLSLLVKSGILRRQSFADGQYIYELVSQLPSGNQLHLLCTSCGKISDFRNSAIIRELGHMKFGTFTPSYLSLTVYGLCAKCQRKYKRTIEKDNLQLKLFK